MLTFLQDMQGPRRSCARSLCGKRISSKRMQRSPEFARHVQLAADVPDMDGEISDIDYEDCHRGESRADAKSGSSSED